MKPDLRLKIEADKLKIEFGGLERILGFKRLFEVPLEDVSRVTVEKPPRSWRDIRSPGTYIPGLIRAGTYYTPRGKEFWYLSAGKTPLIIELKSGEYKRIILGLDKREAEDWKKMLEGYVKAT